MTLSGIERIRLGKAAVDEGFGLPRQDDGEWLAYDSLGTPASIRLNYWRGHYLLGVNHEGVAADLRERWTIWADTNGPVVPLGFMVFSVKDTEPLHRMVHEVWRLARALPIEPLRVFESRTRSLPRATEIERLVVQRVGQAIFRDALMAYWDGRCAVTGVSEPRLLRASHIKPWAKCETDAERLNVYNGLLLVAHIDAAFDAGLVTFADDGQMLISSGLCAHDRQVLGMNDNLALRRVTAIHMANLEWHRLYLFNND